MALRETGVDDRFRCGVAAVVVVVFRRVAEEDLVLLLLLLLLVPDLLVGVADRSRRDEVEFGLAFGGGVDWEILVLLSAGTDC